MLYLLEKRTLRTWRYLPKATFDGQLIRRYHHTLPLLAEDHLPFKIGDYTKSICMECKRKLYFPDKKRRIFQYFIFIFFLKENRVSIFHLFNQFAFSEIHMQLFIPIHEKSFKKYCTNAMLCTNPILTNIASCISATIQTQIMESQIFIHKEERFGDNLSTSYAIISDCNDSNLNFYNSNMSQIICYALLFSILD